MTTLNEMIEIIRAENPNGLRTGNTDIGDRDLTANEYEATIADWAQARLDKQNKIQETEAAKVAAQAKLAALGLTADDLKALGLGNN
jgi:hypothetical protein